MLWVFWFLFLILYTQGGANICFLFSKLMANTLLFILLFVFSLLSFFRSSHQSLSLWKHSFTSNYYLEKYHANYMLNFPASSIFLYLSSSTGKPWRQTDHAREMHLVLTANDQIQDRGCIHTIGQPLVNFQNRKKRILFDCSIVRPVCSWSLWTMISMNRLGWLKEQRALTLTSLHIIKTMECIFYHHHELHLIAFV